MFAKFGKWQLLPQNLQERCLKGNEKIISLDFREKVHRTGKI